MQWLFQVLRSKSAMSPRLRSVGHSHAFSAYPQGGTGTVAESVELPPLLRAEGRRRRGPARDVTERRPVRRHVRDGRGRALEPGTVLRTKTRLEQQDFDLTVAVSSCRTGAGCETSLSTIASQSEQSSKAARSFTCTWRRSSQNSIERVLKTNFMTSSRLLANTSPSLLP
jgi:hypothetical protein